ncbi:phage portal protein [Prauserella muralis]|uniref:phage portal protein n=1 Tax=Prauserella muralis TaxID=588067 RepID=UPI0011BEBD3E|nr:phage portal protein [Prauserella muralis]
MRNDAPVPLASRVQSRIPWFGNLGKLGQLEAMANNGTVFGIVDRIAPSVARTEWKLYRKAASGREEDRTEVTRHSALDLINRPNPHFTRMLLFETSQQHHDLTGEAPWVVSYVRGFARPLELWPVRPDRLVPVPHPTKYLAGWVYQSPDGEQVPLELHEVIFNRRPNPADPYRGMGPVQAVLTDIYGSKAAAEWNKNFFLNSAEPGGIIEIPRSLQDEDFQRLRMRWNEQHKGVSKAHRVAILEEGVWKDRKYTQRDMQFAELRGVSRDAIMEAFGFPKGMLGITEDVNRSNGEVGEEIFARWLVVPRLDRWRDVLNHSLLPLYGKDTAAKYEFDYDSPVPEDEAAENAARESKANTAKTYIDAGFTGESVQEALELPDALVWEKPEPQPAPAPPEPAPGGAPEPPAPEPAPTPTPPEPPRNRHPHPHRHVRNADLPEPPDGVPATDVDAVEAVDLEPVQADWEHAVAGIMATWVGTVVQDWIDQLIEALRAILRGDDNTPLVDIRVDSSDAAQRLHDAMRDLAAKAADHVVIEADQQGADIQPVTPPDADLDAMAREAAALDADRYGSSAAREAARIRPGLPDDEVIERVRQHLDDLSDAGSREMLAAAMTDAQNQARKATLRSVPDVALYASEVLDTNTCAPCRAVHGRWIANSADMTAVDRLYPTGGYIDCLGRWRCRGTIVGIWRPAQTREGEE